MFGWRTLEVNPIYSLKLIDFESLLQGGNLKVWRFETRSTLYKKVKKIQKCPPQDFIDFAIN